MNLADLGSLGEFVGSIVVAITIIILVIQVRQNTAALESTSESEASRDFARFHARTATDPELVELFYRAQTAPEDLSDLEVSRYRWWLSELFYIVESAHKRFVRKQLTQETWDTYLHVLLGHLENPITKDWWDLEMAPFSQEFRDRINAARKDVTEIRHQVPTGAERVDT